MAVHHNFAQAVLKGLIGQDTSAPSYLCKISTLGLGTADPYVITDTSSQPTDYYKTYELSYSSGYSYGYDRCLLGNAGTSLTYKMSAPDWSSGSSSVMHTINDTEILVLGENLSGSTWNVSHFLLFNTDIASELSDYQEGKSKHLVLWGNLTSTTPVYNNQVPLFRKNQFEIKFTG